MSKIEYLQQQAARAERLARDVLDKLTIERLCAYSADCRAQAMTLSDWPQPEAV